MKGEVALAAVEIRSLTRHTKRSVRRGLDAILLGARSLLVGAGGHLASTDERSGDAEGDRTRILLFARAAAAPVGLIDAVLHAPTPGDLMIAQIAVRKDARRRGVARALVLEALSRAGRRAAVSRVVAAVTAGNHGALEFWERIGLEVVEEGTTIVLAASAEALGKRAAEPYSPK